MLSPMPAPKESSLFHLQLNIISTSNRTLRSKLPNCAAIRHPNPIVAPNPGSSTLNCSTWAACQPCRSSARPLAGRTHPPGSLAQCPSAGPAARTPDCRLGTAAVARQPGPAAGRRSTCLGCSPAAAGSTAAAAAVPTDGRRRPSQCRTRARGRVGAGGAR